MKQARAEEKKGTTYGGPREKYSRSQLPAESARTPEPGLARTSRIPLSANNLSAQIHEASLKHRALAKLHISDSEIQRSKANRQAPVVVRVVVVVSKLPH